MRPRPPFRVPNALPAYRLAPGVRLRRSSDGDVLLVPEGIVSLSSTAAAIVELIDGTANEASIAARLAERFDAPLEELNGDVAELLGSLAERGFLRA
jgi:pyrroloquinoline quinone biosynthesis protein D